MNLPNKLTVLRIILMPVMAVLLFFKLYILGAVVFVIATVTDMLDGMLARKNNLVTTFGKFVDPLADKLLNISALVIITYIVSKTQAQWYAIFVTIAAVVITSREIIITSLRALAANEGVVIAADKLGKVKTVIQDIAIVAMLADQFFLNKNISFAGEIVHWTAAIMLATALLLTIISGINYFTSNKEIMEKIKNDI